MGKERLASAERAAGFAFVGFEDGSEVRSARPTGTPPKIAAPSLARPVQPASAGAARHDGVTWPYWNFGALLTGWTAR